MIKLNTKEQGYAKLRDPAFVNELAKTIHVDNVARGWYDSPRSNATLLQLCVTELAEATEGLRKNLMDDKLPHRLMEEVEQADFIIRLLDFCGFHKMELDLAKFCGGERMLDSCKCYLRCSAWLDAVEDCLYEIDSKSDVMIKYWMKSRIGYSINAIINLAEHKGYDTYEAMREKLAFNAVRNDHARSDRANENGKKF